MRPRSWSAGYSRHRADFYLAHERPKKLWLCPLVAEARRWLRAVQVPEACRAGPQAAPSSTLPVKAEQVDSLLEVFRRASDSRDDNTRYRIGPVLTLIALALLAGRRETAEIARFATTLTPLQRRRAGRSPLTLTPSAAIGQPGAHPQCAVARADRRPAGTIPAAVMRTPSLPSGPRPGPARTLMSSKRKTLGITDGEQAEA